MMEVCVIGAGITGLSTAINIQKLMKHVTVTVAADSFGASTTSPVTPGIFLPIPSKFEGMDAVRIRELLIDSWRHHSEMASSPLGQESGQYFMSGHCKCSPDLSEKEDYIIPDYVNNYVETLETKENGSGDVQKRKVCAFETIIVDCVKYLRWMMKEFRQLGGKVVHRKIDSCQQLYGQYDVVVNCTGKRARETVEDPVITRKKVQCILINIPERELLNFVIDDQGFYVLPIPNTDLAEVGLSVDPDVYISWQDKETSDKLLEKAVELIPELEGSKIVNSWAESRAYRAPPRIDVDMIRCCLPGGPVLPVVNNLGLGAEGVTWAWGCGVEAAHLVQDCQRQIKPFSAIWKPFDPKS